MYRCTRQIFLQCMVRACDCPALMSGTAGLSHRPQTGATMVDIRHEHWPASMLASCGELTSFHMPSSMEGLNSWRRCSVTSPCLMSTGWFQVVDPIWSADMPASLLSFSVSMHAAKMTCSPASPRRPALHVGSSSLVYPRYGEGGDNDCVSCPKPCFYKEQNHFSIWEMG
jgi:hypothetical protein